MSGGCMDDVIGKLTAAQALQLVERLTRRGGELREAVIAEALELLADVDIDETAGEVFTALDCIDVQDCWDRSGSSRHGYTSPDEAAAELIEEELQSFVDQVERYHQLGMIEQEARSCAGIVAGLYRYDKESKTEFRQWSEDVAGDCAGALLGDWRERNPAKAAIGTMRALLAERCPQWVEWLDRK
jgi:hypothetical protein